MLKYIIPLMAMFGSGLSFAQINTAPAYLTPYVPEAAEVGSGRLHYMLWQVYDAKLYATAGKWSGRCPFSLNLSYLRSLNGADIADRSMEEIRKQGFNNEILLATWHQQLRNILPNIEQGTTLSGICTSDGHTVFLKNGDEIGRIRDTDFSKHFFDIWLSERTSEPALRANLLGLP